jgi:lactoylglutathione lyase
VLALAKPALDIGLYTNDWEAARAFYVDHLGLPYEELLPAGRGVHQHRLSLHGAVLKVNHSREPLDDGPGAYRALLLAERATPSARAETDPDGNQVEHIDLPAGAPEGAGVVVTAPDPEAYATFLVECLGATRQGGDDLQVGRTTVRLEPAPGPLGDIPLRARGIRYLTVQVFDVVAAHAELVASGLPSAVAPRRLGDVAAISFVRDPAGGWLEVSQRASLTGPLPVL